MTWTLRATAILLIAWVAFMLSPFVALYDLAKAVEARDPERVGARVNFHALRTSLSRQVAAEYLKTPAGKQDLGGLDPQVAANAGSAIVDPLIERLVTPQALIDLLEDGWPQAAIGRAGSTGTSASLEVGSFAQAFKLFVSSETQGFRSIFIPFPADVSRDKQFRLTLRLSGTMWRVTGLELPEALRRQLIRRATRPNGLGEGR